MAPAQHGSRRLWSRTRNLSVPESSGVRYLADWLEHAKEPHHEDYDFEVPRKSRLHRTGVPAQIYVRSPSLRSTTATASDSHGDFSSNTDDYSSGSSDRYSGFNSPVYAQSHLEFSAQIHSLLDASATPIIWDVRQPLTTLTTSHSISRLYGQNALSFPLISNGSSHVLILSKDFPWSIEIGPKSRAITASDVLHAIYDLLHKDLDDTVWGLADDGKKDDIEKTWKKRPEPGDKPKNVDLLGKRFMFKGFSRDDRYARKRVLPGSSVVPDTWILSLGKK